MKSKFAYEDIIQLPHPTSKKHPRMSMAERAAQFSPFAALTGFEAVIRETGRLTDQRVELGESDREELERRLNYLDAQEDVFLYRAWSNAWRSNSCDRKKTAGKTWKR